MLGPMLGLSISNVLSSAGYAGLTLLMIAETTQATAGPPEHDAERIAYGDARRVPRARRCVIRVVVDPGLHPRRPSAAALAHRTS